MSDQSLTDALNLLVAKITDLEVRLARVETKIEERTTKPSIGNAKGSGVLYMVISVLTGALAAIAIKAVEKL